MNTRRHFLRSLGSCVALPAFTSLGGARAAEAAKLATTAGGAPLRSAFFFFPNGSIPKFWWPEKPGADFTMSPTLKPLEEVRQHVQILGGLENLNGEGQQDGAGDHVGGVAHDLTGVRIKKTATDIHAGQSIDQVIARKIGHLTRLSSLEMSCDAVRKSAPATAAMPAPISSISRGATRRRR